MRKLLILSLISFLFLGCISPTLINYSDRKREEYSIPELNTVTTVSIGDTMLIQAKATMCKTIHLKAKFYCANPGIYELIGTTQKGTEVYKPIKETGAGFSIVAPYSSDDICLCLGNYTDTANNRKYENAVNIATLNINSKDVCRGKRLPELLYEICDKDDISAWEAAFQQSLIYTGRDKNNLKFTYREFYENTLRSAFTVNVQYDLSISDVISYKEAKLQILEATNTSITYKVISNFTKKYIK